MIFIKPFIIYEYFRIYNLIPSCLMMNFFNYYQLNSFTLCCLVNSFSYLANCFYALCRPSTIADESISRFSLVKTSCKFTSAVLFTIDGISLFISYFVFIQIPFRSYKPKEMSSVMGGFGDNIGIWFGHDTTVLISLFSEVNKASARNLAVEHFVFQLVHDVEIVGIVNVVLNVYAVVIQQLPVVAVKGQIGLGLDPIQGDGRAELDSFLVLDNIVHLANLLPCAVVHHHIQQLPKVLNVFLTLLFGDVRPVKNGYKGIQLWHTVVISRDIRLHFEYYLEHLAYFRFP